MLAADIFIQAKKKEQWEIHHIRRTTLIVLNKDSLSVENEEGRQR